MNVKSRGHKLDTKWSQLFPEIKHPPGIKTRWVYPSLRLVIKPNHNLDRSRGADQSLTLLALKDSTFPLLQPLLWLR
jgi:hypothetical protein